MKLVKSLLLGSAAGLVAVAGASAADLGVKKPTAVEYVKTCPTYGAGFFVVPGTTSCLKLVGRVRADYIVNSPNIRTGNHNTFRARAYLGFDHRTATEYGLLRTYVRTYFTHENGAAGTTVEYAFIQFGGLAAGRVAPIFEHGWSPFYDHAGSLGHFSDTTSVNSLGYTANLGGGFSASIALDDPRDRRALGTADTKLGYIYKTADGKAPDPANPATGAVGVTPAAAGTAGASLPDIVASLGLDQSWGSAKLSGAITQNRARNADIDTKYGYAVEGGVKVLLPFLTKGSNFFVSGSYASGALSYTGWGDTSIGDYKITSKGKDVVTVGTSLKATTSYAFAGALQVFATPTVSVALGGSYGAFDPTGSNNTVKAYAAIGQVQWSPVAGFLIGAEAAYRKLSFNGGAAATGGSVSNAVNLGTKKDDIVGRLRIQRDF